MGTEAIRLVLGTDPLSGHDSIELTPELVVRSPTPTAPRLVRATAT